MKTQTVKSEFSTQLYTLLSLLVLGFLITGCEVPTHTKTTYVFQDTHRQPEDIQIKYYLPIIEPTSTTTQTQTNGGVAITTEIVPIEVTKHMEQKREITYADPDMPGYDIYEVTNIPSYQILSEGQNHLKFRIRIRNNEKVPLVLSQVGFLLAIDGINYSFPEGYIKDWKEGLIITGEEKTYTIVGPAIDGLINSKIVRLFINGVPVSYDGAGRVTKKESFEWFFECKSQEVQKEERITYTYESSPVYKETCKKCSGTGIDPQRYKCSSCNGKGTYVNAYDKKTYTCRKCSGHGYVQYKCSNCYGSGVKSLPKSQKPPVKTSTTWIGAKITIVTTPPGASVSVINTETGEYQQVGVSNTVVDWYSSSQKSYPINVFLNGQNVNVLPYHSESGKLISRVVIDFTSGVPIVKAGTIAL